MSLVSLEFLLFLAGITVVYFMVPKKIQWMVLLAASVYFYMSAGAKAIVFLTFTAVASWYTAILLERINEKYKKLREETCSTREEKQKNRQLCTKSKKRVMLLTLGVNFGIWIVFKYAEFFLINLDKLLAKLWGKAALPIPQWVIPLGISFYTFTAMGYCIDIYRGKYKAEKNFLRFFAFVLFFPHIVQGPFSRYDVLSKTLYEEHTFDFDRMCRGSLRILWGMFKKLVVANNIALVVDTIYGDIATYSGIYIWVAIMLFVLELYADFSGYMDIVVGMCCIWGVRLQENFKQPFFSRSIEEFWRRWHMTLGAWFRDYLFYSVSMSKRVQSFGRKCKDKIGAQTARLIPSYIALFFVWTVTGLWHGADWTFLIWGWMNLFIIAASMQLAPLYQKARKKLHIRENNRWWKLIQMGRTFLLFGFMEMFSEASSIGTALSMCASMLTFEHWTYLKEPMLLLPSVGMADFLPAAAGLVLMFVVDILREKGRGIFEILHRIPCVIRYTGYAAILYTILIFGEIGNGMSGGFMYAQF